MSIQFPEKLGVLFDPYRYKIVYGGRGGAKSWGVARALLISGASQKIRILCTREIQKSIKDSVHRLLSDQIQALGLGYFYEVLDTEIRSRNGTEIIFAGLANHTVDSIKSYEGIDRVWVEEAQTVSKKSWDILIPTIRKPDSEIWVTFNPILDTDDVWRRFVENVPPKSCVIEMNYRDNPWFPVVLEDERKHCQATDLDNYSNIWEGKCRTAVAGAIYANEIAASLVEGRVSNMPYDPRLKVHTVWDMGWNDSMTIGLVQKGLNDIRVIGYIESNFKTLDWYAAELNRLNYNWGYDWLPHDAKAGDYKTGMNAHQILKRFGRKTKEVPNIGVEPGIKAARMLFPRCYFDKIKTARLVESLKRYRRAVPVSTGEPGSPVHDEYSHAADMFRYLAVIVEQLRNEDYAPMPTVGYGVLDAGVGY